MAEQYERVRETFLGYYERELSYLRKLGVEFGAKYPLVASRLRLEAAQCDDPHVERMIESFAFLAARIHLRLDDEFPEITSALLSELYPYFTQPIPSTSLVEFQLDPERGKSTTGRLVQRGTSVETRPAKGFSCRFRTCYDTELWPVTVTSAHWRPGSSLPQSMATESRPTAAAIELKLSCMADVTFASLPLTHLRFYLNGTSDLVYATYELLLARCHTIIVQDATPGKPPKEIRLDPGSLTPAGFGAEEGLCWFPKRSFAGYQILEDFFTFPEKFLFVDLKNLERVTAAGMGKDITVLFLLSPFERAEWRSILEQGINANTFKLGCTPIVNLFPASADQNLVRPTVYEMPVQVDSRMEIYSVDTVFGVTPSGERRQYEPFINCQDERASQAGRYWHTMRRQSRHDDLASEVSISLVDRQGQPAPADVSTLLIKLTCTNGNLPHELPRESQGGLFQMAQHPEVQNIACLRQPTQCHPAAIARTSLWRLVSQLSLNHLSLVDGGKEALQCLLEIHNLTGSDLGKESIRGILKLSSKPHFARVSSEHGMAFVRGKRVEIQVDEERFAGNTAFLFGSVIDHFLGLYTSLNSFSQLVLKSRQRGDKPIHIFPPRAGTRIVA